jgi:hypothetical protein
MTPRLKVVSGHLAVYRPIPRFLDFSGLCFAFFLNSCHNKSTIEYACRSRGASPFKFKVHLILKSLHPLPPQMFDQYTSPIMLHSPHIFDPYKDKVNPGHLYVRQPHDAIQIIQLVEASPPPRRISSDIESSFSSGSSYPSTSDSEDDEDCSSYCSSFVTPPHPSQHREPVVWTDDTYDVRMKRIQKWRDNSMSALAGMFFPSIL